MFAVSPLKGYFSVPKTRVEYSKYFSLSLKYAILFWNASLAIGGKKLSDPTANNLKWKAWNEYYVLIFPNRLWKSHSCYFCQTVKGIKEKNKYAQRFFLKTL